MRDGRWRTWIQRIAGEPAATGGPPEPAGPAPDFAASPLSPDEALRQLLARVDSWRPRARFLCARHGTEAATVKLIRRFTEDSELIVESALGRGSFRLKTPADQAATGDPVAEELQEVLARADAGWLHFMNPQWALFYCAECQRVYCGACWTVEDVPDPEHPGFPALRATCPEGHSSTPFG